MVGRFLALVVGVSLLAQVSLSCGPALVEGTVPCVVSLQGLVVPSGRREGQIPK